MKYMTCNACRAVVEVNNTGICLGCQMGLGKFIESALPEAKSKSESEQINSFEHKKRKKKEND